MFEIFATIRIKAEERDRFLATINDTAARSVRDEPGCVRFDVFQDESDENHYLLYEVYTDKKAFEKHLVTPHARQAMEGSKQWAESSFEVTRAISVFPTEPGSFDTLASSS